MRTSEQIQEIATAFSKAQAAFLNAKKDSLNPHFNKKYADLAAVIEATKEPLGQNDLSITQGCFFKDNHWILVTKMTHKSGQWFESDFPLLTREATAQAMGSAVKYARRYAYECITGVAAEDDDGNAASGKDVKNADTVRDAPRMGPGSPRDRDDANQFDQRPEPKNIHDYGKTAPLSSPRVEPKHPTEPKSFGQLKFINGIYEGCTYDQVLENELKTDFKWTRSNMDLKKKGNYIPKSYEMFIDFVKTTGRLRDE